MNMTLNYTSLNNNNYSFYCTNKQISFSGKKNQYEEKYKESGSVSIPLSENSCVKVKNNQDFETFSFVETSGSLLFSISEAMDFYPDGSVCYYTGSDEVLNPSDEQIVDFVDKLNENNVFMPKSIENKSLDIEKKRTSIIQKNNMESLQNIAYSLAELNRILINRPSVNFDSMFRR